MMNRDLEMACRLAECVARQGGRVYYVGGYVRDGVLGRENKDIDVEVHGIAPAALESILDELGERTVMGASFGIYGLKHYDLDIAMPRSERQTGCGHRDFDVLVDPFLGTQKAARRRDFTINALMQDVLTGEILDYFGGLADLKNGVIRHVNDTSFAEDPLRVFRAAQFAARFGFAVAPETMELCASMNLDALARERVMEELGKALMKAAQPSVFFHVLRGMNQLDRWFPEFAALALRRDAWQRAMAAIDCAARLSADASYPAGFMLAALCCELDESAADAFISRLSSELRLKKYLLNMVQLRDEPGAVLGAGCGRTACMRLFDRALEPGDLLCMVRVLRGEMPAEDALLAARLGEYRARMAERSVRGEDLVRAGMKPGVQIGRGVAYAHELHLEGVDWAEALKRTLEYIGGAAE